jgi:hypothetical protein
MTKADAALLVTNNDESGETETTATLNNLGDAVDRDKLVNEFAIAFFAVLAIVARTSSFLCHCPFPFSFPGAIGKQNEDRIGLSDESVCGPVKIRPAHRASGRKFNQKVKPPSRAASAKALMRP